MQTLMLTTSNVIDRITYSRRVMKIRFKEGRVYSFRGVPRSIFDGFKKATSFGSYFNREIKGKFLTIQM